ncbi:hypothetical protein [Chitinophaga tropicalis]|uniref:Uncharacterized protein n=1 Tax=Chitinophaga tropicalis TaxID=2683588 RepID=A0A7K1UAK0_9BACT|nr:hypothetical protein [Chitinophaga tropicalis]MVT11402.1 hypothetical protein [Chitinophaga tropicalis]
MDQDLLIDSLKEKIYQFFPKNIDGLSEAYTDTIEFKQLTEICCHYRENKEPWSNFIKAVQVAFPGKTIRDETKLFIRERCYHLLLKVENSASRLLTLNLTISIIMPYYDMFILEFEKTDPDFAYLNLLQYKRDLSEYSEEVNKLQTLIGENFSHQQLPGHLAEYIIPDISYNSIQFNEFTMFNALFLDRL